MLHTISRRPARRPARLLLRWSRGGTGFSVTTEALPALAMFLAACHYRPVRPRRRTVLAAWACGASWVQTYRAGWFAPSGEHLVLAHAAGFELLKQVAPPSPWEELQALRERGCTWTQYDAALHNEGLL
jgi:hypothetical protein